MPFDGRLRTLNRISESCCASYCDKQYGIVILDKIVVPKDQRKNGIGTDVMKMLIEFVDETKSILMLTPSTSLGATSINRLKKFYKQFGLKNNSGKTKIYQLPLYGMYRFPE
jgi:predicted GNAT family N-acyltransferase